MNVNHNLKLVYSEILSGYSPVLYKGELIYIKHLNQLDTSLADIKKQQYIEYFQSLGAITYNNKLKEIISNNLWSESKDKEIDEVRSFILNLEHSQQKCNTKKEKNLIHKDIQKYNERLFKLIIEKDNLIGKTADSRANNKIKEYYIYISLFKDKDCKYQLFTEEEFDLLEDTELIKFQKIYNNKIMIFNETNLKKIALMPYFFNLYILSGDNLMSLFGKPLVYLTTYQIELIQKAKNYKNILQNSKSSPPPECLSDPDKLIEWFDKSNTLDKIMENTEVQETPDKKILEAAKSMVGMTKEELKEAGIDTNAQDKITEELKKRKEKGLSGEIGMMDLIKMGM